MTKAEKVTRVGIITFHNARNNGAVLQAYALTRFLNTLSSVEAEIVDYRCEAIDKVYQPEFCFYNCGRLKGLIKFLIRKNSIEERNRMFDEFSRRYLKISSLTYHRATISAAATAYDYMISGSDQIWNYELTDYDSSYLLDFTGVDSKKISYAASLGVLRIEKEAEDSYRNLLSRYRYLSVREQGAAKELYRLTKRHAAVHIDPVFLLDKAEWEMMPVFPGRDNYVLYYMVGMGRIVNESIVFAKQLSKRTKRKLIFLNSEYIPYLYPEIEHIRTVSPDEYLGWIITADYIVTNSFHATCFSIIFEKTCYSEVALHKGDRIADLLHICGLEAYALHHGKLKDPDGRQGINWTAVKERLTASSGAGKQYLLQAVGK